MSRDDYFVLLNDLMAKRDALQKAINALVDALNSGAITDVVTVAAPDPQYTTEGDKP